CDIYSFFYLFILLIKYKNTQFFFFFFQAEDGIRDIGVTGVQTCALPISPYIKVWDEKQEFHPEVLKKMAELNLLGVCIPEEYGGAGFDYISLGLVCEELEAVDTFMRVVMSVHTGLNSLTLLTWGSEEQKQKYLVPQAKGEKLATYGLTEPGAGSDVVGSRSTARREGDEYLLNGEKMWINVAHVADNFLFCCWTDEEKRRNRD